MNVLLILPVEKCLCWKAFCQQAISDVSNSICFVLFFVCLIRKQTNVMFDVITF